MNKHKTRAEQIVDFIYIATLLFIFASTVLLGAVVAPVVFNSGLYLDNTTLGRFDNGLLMSEIFRRFGNILNVALLIVTGYHAYKYKEFLASYLTIFAFAVFAISSLLFNFYFSEGIFSFIMKGEIWIEQNIALFEAFHKASEIDFGIIMFSSLTLAILAFKHKFHS